MNVSKARQDKDDKEDKQDTQPRQPRQQGQQGQAGRVRCVRYISALRPVLPLLSSPGSLGLIGALLPLVAVAQSVLPDPGRLRLPDLAQVNGGGTRSAQTPDVVAPLPAPRRLRGIIAVGVVQGLDDDVVPDEFEGRVRRYHPGNAMVAQLGGEWRFDSPWSIQAAAGVYSESLIHFGGPLSQGAFMRNHVESLAHYRLTSWLRIGGGLRFNYNVRFRPEGASSASSYSDHRVRYRNSVTPVLEAEFWANRRVSMKVRLGFERFRSRDHGPDLGADHLGLMAGINL